MPNIYCYQCGISIKDRSKSRSVTDTHIKHLNSLNLTVKEPSSHHICVTCRIDVAKKFNQITKYSKSLQQEITENKENISNNVSSNCISGYPKVAATQPITTQTDTRKYCKRSYAEMQPVTQWKRRHFMYDAANQMNMTADDVIESFASQSSSKQVN